MLGVLSVSDRLHRKSRDFHASRWLFFKPQHSSYMMGIVMGKHADFMAQLE